MNDGNRDDPSKDDFWDLGKILPPREKRASAFSGEIRMSEYESRGDRFSGTPAAERRITIPADEGGESFSYSPEGNAFIKKITVRKYKSHYSFYEQFRKNAVTCFGISAPKCNYVPFFSYIPQYSQLTAAQRQYYFYWRGELRAGRYIKCDYCYFWLYVYEVLNLPDYIPPEEGVRLLCDVWIHYRGELPKTDKFMAVWIQDYCMVHRLPAPSDLLGDALDSVLRYADIKEFYLGNAERAEDIKTDMLISLLSDYRYREGKYFTDENAPLITERFNGAMERVFSLLFRRGDLFSDSSAVSFITKEAFSGSLCTHNIKARLEIEYCSFRHSERLKSTVTDCMRYIENKIRAQIRVKSRISVRELPEDIRGEIDSYFSLIEGAARRAEEERNRPAYELKYEPESIGISPEDASRIEFESWGVTRDLTDEEPDEPVSDEPKASDERALGTSVPEATEPESTGEASETAVSDDLGLGEARIGILESVFLKGADFSDACEAAGLFPETVMDDVNEAFSDAVIFDTVIKMSGEYFAPVEEYMEDVKNWLQTIRR